MQALPSTEKVIGTYDGWAVSRRDRCIADFKVEGQVFRDSRVIGDNTYSRAEVAQMLDSQVQVLTGAALRDQESQSAGVRALLAAIFRETDRQRVPIEVDAMEALTQGSAVSAIEKAEVKLTSKPSVRNLAPLASGESQSKLLNDAYDEIRRLNERMRAMQTEFDRAMQQRSELSENVLTMQETLGAVKAETDQLSAKQTAELQALHRQAQSTIKTLQAEIATLNGEVNNKLSQSRQFQTLKQMLNEKNESVKQLRTTLAKYDPAAAAVGGDDIEAMDDDD